MKVNINDKEFEALNFAILQVIACRDSGADDVYIDKANNCIKALQDVIRKYKYEREKYREFRYWRAVISERNRSHNLLAKDIDRLTRDFLKRHHQQL